MVLKPADQEFACGTCETGHLAKDVEEIPGIRRRLETEGKG